MRALALIAALLSTTIAHAQTYAFRGGPGVQMTTGASRPTTIAGRRTLWVDSSNRLRFYNGTDDTYPAAIAATTKGDLAAYTGSAWSRLAAGSNGLCLVTDSGEATGLKWAACAASTGYQTVQDEATPLTQRTTINFIGAGVSCVDNAGSSRTDCTIAGGGSTGNWTFAGDAADDSGAAVLTIGATTATGVTLSRSAGTITLAGNTTVAAGKNITAAAGAGAFDLSAASGVFKTPTGASTFGGSSNTFSADVKPSGDYTAYLGDSTHHWSGLYTSQVYNAGGSLVLGSTSSYVRLAPVSGSYASVRLDGSDIWQVYTDRMLWTPNAATSGAKVALTLTGAANTGQTASTEVPDVDLALNRTVEHATGAITTQRAVLVRAPTYSFVGASTISDAATVAVTGAPAAGANGTITRSWSLWTQDGAVLHERDDIGATVGTAGLVVENRTAATAGNQKYSPAIVWSGYGWKTDATAASQSVKVAAQLVPIQGAANPSQQLVFYESINGGGYAQTEINGYGYFGSNDQSALGTATTSSTTFVDVGNGSSTGFASWTAPTTKITKTYIMRVTVRCYVPTVGSTGTVAFQVLQDGVAIASQPTEIARISASSSSQYLSTSWSIAVPQTAGTAHVYKLQWKVGNASDQAGVTTGVGQLQMWIEG